MHKQYTLGDVEKLQESLKERVFLNPKPVSSSV